jgi:alanine racemase
MVEPGADLSRHAVAGERVQALIDVAAIERNSVRLRSELTPGTELCAVVKADGYGHGALPSALAALAGGAGWLAVVSARELIELREAGLREVPILVMGALTRTELEQALGARGDVVIWSERYLQAVEDAGGGRVHVKLDSGMGRLGTRDPERASALAEAAARSASVQLVGAMTHFATADDLADEGFFDEQLAAFGAWAQTIRERHPDVLLHAANSAATMRDAAAHFDLVRCGIAVYGMDPFGVDPAERELEPALELRSYVADLKPCRAGESAGYGRRFIAARDTTIGVLPVGYGDGWRRNLSNNCDVLIGGERHPLVGTISMDSATVDLGPGADQGLVGAPALLIGRQGAARITAEEIARRLQTINYEVTCGLTPRVRRAYHRDGVPVSDIATAAALGGGR